MAKHPGRFSLRQPARCQNHLVLSGRTLALGLSNLPPSQFAQNMLHNLYPQHGVVVVPFTHSPATGLA